MENNLENKAKFFALYYGQKVYRHNAWNTCRESIEVHGSSISNCAFGYLELKNIKYISDEDCLDLVKINKTLDYKGFFMFHPFPKTCQDKRNAISYVKNNIYLEISNDRHNSDLIRSKGYVLPFMGLTVEKLIEYGWVKFKGNA